MKNLIKLVILMIFEMLEISLLVMVIKKLLELHSHPIFIILTGSLISIGAAIVNVLVLCDPIETKDII